MYLENGEISNVGNGLVWLMMVKSLKMDLWPISALHVHSQASICQLGGRRIQTCTHIASSLAETILTPCLTASFIKGHMLWMVIFMLIT